MIRILLRRRSRSTTSSLRHRSARSCFGQQPSHAVPAISTLGIQWSFRPEWVFSATGVHTLGIKGLLSYNANVDPAFNTPTLPRRRLAHNSASASPRPFANSSAKFRGTKTAITCTTRAHPCRYKIHEQAILAQFVLYPLKANNEYDDPTGAGNSLLSNPFNFRATTDRRRPISGTAYLQRHFDPSRLPPFFGKAGKSL